MRDCVVSLPELFHKFFSNCQIEKKMSLFCSDSTCSSSFNPMPEITHQNIQVRNHKKENTRIYSNGSSTVFVYDGDIRSCYSNPYPNSQHPWRSEFTDQFHRFIQGHVGGMATPRQGIYHEKVDATGGSFFQKSHGLRRHRRNVGNVHLKIWRKRMSVTKIYVWDLNSKGHLEGLLQAIIFYCSLKKVLLDKSFSSYLK